MNSEFSDYTADITASTKIHNLMQSRFFSTTNSSIDSLIKTSTTAVNKANGTETDEAENAIGNLADIISNAIRNL